MSESDLAALTAVLEYWHKFNLEGRRNDLDEKASLIGDNKDASLKSRKHLTELTKEVRKLPEPERLQQMPPLLKAYQTEIDKLTRRSKLAEEAYLELFQQLAPAPDPALALQEVSLQTKHSARAKELEFENQKLQQQLSEYKQEHADLQNQEVTIAKLKDRVKQLESYTDDIASERARAKETEVRNEAERALSAFKEREQTLSKRLSQTENELSSLQRQHDVIQKQLYEVTNEREKTAQSMQSEIDMLLEEVTKRTNEASEARQRVARLEATVREHSTAASNSSHLSENSDVDRERRREEELRAARDAQLALERRLESELGRYHDRLASITAELRDVQKERDEYKNKLAAAPTIEQLNRLEKRIDVFRELGYDVDGSLDATRGGTPAERLLRDQLRQRESAAAQAAVACERAEKQVKQLESQLQTTLQERDSARRLAKKLEEDLAVRLSSMNTTASDETALIARLAPRTSYNDLLNDMQQKPTSSPSSPSSSPLLDNGAEPDENHVNAVLSVVARQRDRLQTRAASLESELAAARSDVEAARGETKRVRADNVALYEKIRYLESYSSNTGVHSRSDRTSSDVERKYHDLYEQKMNPFVAFEKHEKQRRLANLNAAERIVITSSRFFLASKITRVFLFAYLVCLHLLVFATLSRYSNHNPHV